LQKTEHDEPWAFFTKLHHSIKSFFSVAIVSELGNGQNTLFWTNNWVQGWSLQKLVPHLFGAIPITTKKRTVLDVVSDMRWVSDIKGAFTVDVLAEYLGVWDMISQLVLQPEVQNTHIWCFSASGKYSAKSAYEACSSDTFNSTLGKGFGKAGPRASVNFSYGLLQMIDAGQLIG
jgi:hypothetical protein